MKMFKTTAEYHNFLQNLSPDVLECYFQCWDETGRPVTETLMSNFVAEAIKVCIEKERTGEAPPEIKVLYNAEPKQHGSVTLHSKLR